MLPWQHVDLLDTKPAVWCFLVLWGYKALILLCLHYTLLCRTFPEHSAMCLSDKWLTKYCIFLLVESNTTKAPHSCHDNLYCCHDNQREVVLFCRLGVSRRVWLGCHDNTDWLVCCQGFRVLLSVFTLSPLMSRGVWSRDINNGPPAVCHVTYPVLCGIVAKVATTETWLLQLVIKHTKCEVSLD